MTITLDPLARKLEGPNGGAHLTPAEATILHLLARRQSKVVRDDAIENALYSLRPNAEWPSSNLITVHTCRIRKKLVKIGADGPSLSRLYCEGYILLVPVELLISVELRCKECGQMYLKPEQGDRHA